MNILVLAWEFPPRIIGGIARHVAGLFPEVARLGYQVHLLTVATENAPPEEIVEGIHVHRLPIPDHEDFFHWVRTMNQTMISVAKDLFAETPFALVHGHDWLVADAAISLAEICQLPLIATIHATEYGRHNGIHNNNQLYVSDQEKRLAGAAQSVIVCSEYMRQEVGRALDCDAAKVEVIYNGIAPRQSNDWFDRLLWRAKFAEPDEKIIYYVGRLAHEKGIFLLLNAFPKVLAEMASKVRCVIIGSGNSQEILLKRQAWNLGIYEKVTFTGFMPDQDLPRFQAIADCAVFPSLYEPFGIVALESFAAGVPVVVSDTGGLPEVVHDGITGVVTKVNNVSSLAEGILKVLQNEDFRKHVTSNAYKDLQERFAWPYLAQQTSLVYAKSITKTAD